MKYVYYKPQIKVVNIDGEVVMISASVGVEMGNGEKGDEIRNKVGAKPNFFSDSPFSSSPISSGKDEKE